MSNRFVNPTPQFVDESGLPYSGGTLAFYLTGSSTLASIWQAATLTGPATNPQTLNAKGFCPQEIFLDPSITYKAVLTASDGTVIWTRDPCVDLAANVTAAFQVYAGDPNGNVAGSAGSVGGSGASVVYDITNHLLYVCTTTGTTTTAVWSQVAAVLSGAVIMSGSITPTALGADADDYAPTGIATAHRVRISASAAYNVTGLTAGAEGRLLELVNVGSFPITLLSENTASAAANRFKFGWDVTLQPNQAISLDYDGTSSRWRSAAKAEVEPISEPGGRLTLTTAVPVLSSDVTSSTSILYTPKVGVHAPLWNGTTMMMAPWESELTLALDSNSGHTGYHQSGKNFDLFLVKDNKTFRLVTGPAWTNDTTRATALEYKRGFQVNAAAMTARYDASASTLTVAQDVGLFIGTVRMSADGTTKWVANPAAAAGGGNCQLLLWNTYNRVNVSAASKDSTDSWTYTTATWRAANGNNSNRITAVFGLNEDAVSATYTGFGQNSTGGGFNAIGVGLDSTSAFSGSPAETTATSGSPQPTSMHANYAGLPGLGLHFFQALEYSIATNTTTWYGDNGAPLNTQMALTLLARM